MGVHKLKEMAARDELLLLEIDGNDGVAELEVDIQYDHRLGKRIRGDLHA